MAWTAKRLKGSSFKLRSSLGRSIKTEQDVLRDVLVCWNFSSLRRLRQRSELGKGGSIDHHFAPLGTSSAKMTESIDVELAMKWSYRPGFFSAALVLGNFSCLRALQRRDSEMTREKTQAFSRMMSASGTQ